MRSTFKKQALNCDSFTNFRSIPSQGNKAELSLAVLHRNFLGVDEFLGQITLPLRDLDMNERQNIRSGRSLKFTQK